ncbi:hypothetical protein Nepgr_005277 [Nepenthes gracilis]|uniref:Uncharacterized protein n=1 Tax=Nepenthes gracilis TaxID=150966 RepID=A0AAD3S2V9_NEPGR|nr:hypothetical protein Nepgr_005277 [Nepenthes gracilis]
MVGLNCLNHGSEAADAFLQPVDVCMPAERFHDAVIDKHRAALLKMGSQCSLVCCLLNLGAAAAMVNSGPDSADCMAKGMLLMVSAILISRMPFGCCECGECGLVWESICSAEAAVVIWLFWSLMCCCLESLAPSLLICIAAKMLLDAPGF